MQALTNTLHRFIVTWYIVTFSKLPFIQIMDTQLSNWNNSTVTTFQILTSCTYSLCNHSYCIVTLSCRGNIIIIEFKRLCSPSFEIWSVLKVFLSVPFLFTISLNVDLTDFIQCSNLSSVKNLCFFYFELVLIFVLGLSILSNHVILFHPSVTETHFLWQCSKCAI